MGLAGFEPATSPLSGVRSNQLSYKPGPRMVPSRLWDMPAGVVTDGKNNRRPSRGAAGRSTYRGSIRPSTEGSAWAPVADQVKQVIDVDDAVTIGVAITGLAVVGNHVQYVVDVDGVIAIAVA